MILEAMTTVEIWAKLGRLLHEWSQIRRDEPLAKRTTLRVGGPAEVFVEPSSDQELSAILRFCSENDVPWFVLGRGSNLLIRDGGIRGVVISLSHPHFSRIEFQSGRILAGAGARLKNVAIEARRQQISGMEFLEGIPGTVGGALRMNAGAMGSEMFCIVQSVRYMDRNGEIAEESSDVIPHEYRSCTLLRTHIALSAILAGTPAEKSAIEAKMKECSEKRWSSQPAAPSAGCIFKNPETISAGRLIQELGLKGTKFGGAMISEEHGNFIINDGNATAKEVLDLIDFIKDKARRERGIELRTEVEIVGEDA
jgi:UDP-N-acetylenolpyruvoylglucosamine reductase